jgi:hypothetical protein
MHYRARERQLAHDFPEPSLDRDGRTQAALARSFYAPSRP